MALPLLSYKFDPKATGLISPDIARFYKILPIAMQQERLLCAVCAPSAVEEVEALTNQKVEPVIYTQEEILNAIDSVYQLKPPDPISTADESSPSLEIEEVLKRMEPALKRRPSESRTVYALVGGEAELETIFVDEILAQGATCQTRVYWCPEGVYEELNEKMYQTSAISDEHFNECMRRLRVVAGLPRTSMGAAHSRFEMDFGGWKFVGYAAFTDEGALLEFHPKT